MRIFKTKPLDPGHETHHLWTLIAVEEDGTEVTLDTYATMAEANAAKAVLERQDMEDPS